MVDRVKPQFIVHGSVHGPDWAFKLSLTGLGLGLGGLGTKGLRLGLDNYSSPPAAGWRLVKTKELLLRLRERKREL